MGVKLLQIFKKVSSKISTIMIMLDAGARAEGNDYSLGLAHFCEHMVFKGTPTRNYLQIPKEIACLGGSVNAFTSQELVTYFISIPYEHTEKAIEILSDLVFNSTFPVEEVVKEKEVVKEEEVSGRDQVEEYMWNELSQNFFNGRLSRPIIGTAESIAKFSREELEDFYNKFYKKSNAMAVLCSSHKKKEGKELLQKYFGKPSKKIKRNVKIYSPLAAPAKTLELTWPKMEQSHLMFCWPGVPVNSTKQLEIKILLDILGQGMDSRLFTEAREKLGLCYEISSSVVGYRDSGALIVEASTRPENIEKLKEVILREIDKLKEISEEELESAKNKFRAYNYAVTEGSYVLAKNEAFRKFFDLPNLEKVEKQIMELTVADLQLVAQDLFDHTKLLTVICQEGKNEN